jgi:cobalt-zinc-cadmium efflux system protein
MSQYHHHDAGDAHHQHQTHYKAARYIGIALLLTGGYAVVETLASFSSGSLALLSDAGHMLTDTAALALAFIAQRFAARPASNKLSFGYTRVEIIAAFVNALVMLGIIVWIVWQAVGRLIHPTPVQGETVTVVATIGLCVNLVVAWLLLRDQTSMNARAAFIHVLGDLLGSVAAIAAGLVIWYTGWLPIDPILSMIVAVLLLNSTWGLLKESGWHLMDGVPHEIEYEHVGEDLQSIAGIASVHDLHIWNMSPNQPVLIAHVELEPEVRWPILLESARLMLRDKHKIEHITLQPEWQDEAIAYKPVAENKIIQTSFHTH